MMVAANNTLNEDVLSLIFNELLILPKDSDRARSVYRYLAPPKSYKFRLSADSVRYLGNASLVCKAWSPVAQEMLLHILNLTETGYDDDMAPTQFIRDWNASKPLPSRAMLLEVGVDIPRHSVPDLNCVRTLAENCSKLQLFAASFHTNRLRRPADQLVLPLCAPAHTDLTTFCLSICNSQFDREQVHPFHGAPPQKPPSLVVDWIEFLQVLVGMPSLNKLIVSLHAGSGFTNFVEPGTLAGNGEVALKPIFKLQYVEISTWELILSPWQYECVTASSHSTLQTAIVHLEAIEALMDCRASLTRVRILDYNRWKMGQFIIPDSTLKLVPSFLGSCPNLIELTAHVEVVEAFMQSSTASVSHTLKRLMIGQFLYDFGKISWTAKYQNVYSELVSGPLSELVDGPFSNSSNGSKEASKRQWQKRLPNLRTVVLEVLSDGELSDNEDFMDENDIFLALKEGARASGRLFWMEVHVDDLNSFPPADNLGLA